MIGTRAGLFIVSVVAVLSALALVGSLIDTAWASVSGSAIVLALCLGAIGNLRARVQRLSR